MHSFVSKNSDIKLRARGAQSKEWTKKIPKPQEMQRRR